MERISLCPRTGNRLEALMSLIDKQASIVQCLDGFKTKEGNSGWNVLITGVSNKDDPDHIILESLPDESSMKSRIEECMKKGQPVIEPIDIEKPRRVSFGIQTTKPMIRKEFMDVLEEFKISFKHYYSFYHDYHFCAKDIVTLIAPNQNEGNDEPTNFSAFGKFTSLNYGYRNYHEQKKDQDRFWKTLKPEGWIIGEDPFSTIEPFHYVNYPHWFPGGNILELMRTPKNIKEMIKAQRFDDGFSVICDPLAMNKSEFLEIRMYSRDKNIDSNDEEKSDETNHGKQEESDNDHPEKKQKKEKNINQLREVMYDLMNDSLGQEQIEWLAKDGIKIKRVKQKGSDIIEITPNESARVHLLIKFVSERCTIKPKTKILTSKFHTAYIEWMEANHPTEYQMSKPFISKTLFDNYGIKKTKSNGNTVYLGIILD